MLLRKKIYPTHTNGGINHTQKCTYCVILYRKQYKTWCEAKTYKKLQQYLNICLHTYLIQCAPRRNLTTVRKTTPKVTKFVRLSEVGLYAADDSSLLAHFIFHVKTILGRATIVKHQVIRNCVLFSYWVGGGNS